MAKESASEYGYSSSTSKYVCDNCGGVLVSEGSPRGWFKLIKDDYSLYFCGVLCSTLFLQRVLRLTEVLTIRERFDKVKEEAKQEPLRNLDNISEKTVDIQA